jgi:hypothetical protein
VWAEVFASTPTGSNTRLYIGADRSRAMVARAAATKRLADIVSKEYPAARISASPKDGIVFAGGKPAIKVATPAQNETTLQWCGSILTAASMSRDRVQTLFDAAADARRVDRVQWEL